MPLEDLIRVSKVSNEKYKIDLITNSSHMTYNLFFCLSLYINSVIDDHDYWPSANADNNVECLP